MTQNQKNEFGEVENLAVTEHVKCSGCGANMEFDPEKQLLSCPHCGNVLEFNTDTVASEKDLLEGFSLDNQWESEEASAFKCENCGAKVVLSKGESACECPFCGTSHVKKTDELLGVKPNALLPFTFNSDKAAEYAKKWAKKLFFATKKFKKNLNPQHVKGVYTPCFTFDSYTTSSYVGRIGTTHTRTVGSGKNRRTETYTVWRNIAGTYYGNFDDVLITAGSKFNQQKLDKISPFSTNDSKEYDQKYLLGFMAYHYDCEIEDCWDDAKACIDKSIKKGILSQYVHDKVAYLNVSTKHERVTYKYVMLPVYVGSMHFAKKDYNFYVNGNTGRIWGKYPKSVFKILLTVLLGLLVVAGIGLLVYYFGLS